MNNEKETKRKLSSILVSCGFLIVIGAFFAVSVFMNDKAFSDNENRELAGIPEISSESIARGDFSKGFEVYVQDQFPGRDGLMSIKTKTEKAAGKKDNGLVYFGSEGYLFAVEDIDMIQLDKNISYLNRFAEENDIEMRLAVIPTASYVLQDKLPKYLNTKEEEEAFENINTNVKTELLDVRDVLKEHSDEYIYYKTDHHWTTLGAYYAYTALSGTGREIDDYDRVKVSDAFLGTNYSKAMLASTDPDSIYRYDLIEDNGEYSMDIFEGEKKTRSLSGLYDEAYLNMKDKYSYFLAGNNPVTVIEPTEKSDNKNNILVVKDSFAHCYIPFIAADCSRIVAVDMRYYRKGLTDIINEYGIDEILFLYNIVNFSNDRNLVFINR